jgi:hypothetical protein
MAISSYYIDDYSINGYSWLLVAIGGYSINAYWWLFY